MALLMTLAACAPATPSAGPAGTGLRVVLPASLESQRARYEVDARGALGDVMRWFQEQEVGDPQAVLIRDVLVLGDAAEARRAVAARFEVPEDQVPDDFGGTIDGDALLVVSREAYAATFQRLYPEVPWTDGEYRRLLAHEMAHRAHELAAISLTGSPEGMGPRWFFEGLALACAGQFAASAPGSLSWDEVRALIAEDGRRPLGYPRYADMFRSVARIASVKDMVTSTGRATFEELMRRPRER